MVAISFLIHTYLYLSIYEFLTEESKKFVKWLFLLLFGGIKYLVELSTYTSYLWPFLSLTLLVVYSICVQSKHSHLENLKYAIVTYGMDIVFTIIIASVFSAIGGLFRIAEANWSFLFSGISRSIFIIAIYKKKISFAKIKQAWILYIGTIATTVLLFSEQITRVGHITDNNNFVYMAVSCSYIAALFTTLWLLDHYKMLKIQNEYAADNKQMSQKLHRSKEVLPLIADYVANIDDTEDEVMRQKLAEVCHDYGKELSNEELKTGLFNTTGIPMLDLMFQKKMKECAAKSIEFNVFVSTRIDEDMKRLGVNDGELLRIMGDLLRNAMNAVEEAHNSPDAMILAVVARDELGHVEFHVHDSGVPFPDEVLENFGERGVTTWGTGNGIADLIETLQRVSASMEIIPEPDSDDMFTKEILIRFDGEGLIKHGRVSA